MMKGNIVSGGKVGDDKVPVLIPKEPYFDPFMDKIYQDIKKCQETKIQAEKKRQ